MRELSAPPPSPVPWTFRSKTTRSQVTVEKVVISRDTITIERKTWFAARAEAARVLGVPPEDLEVVNNPLGIPDHA